ncbi:MAG: hypothetical protein LQ342_002488 [Letrouitia transgressa]|nr:MAG: hypothetical protein LQ342_002488 [Letrouitia transgressa]
MKIGGIEQGFDLELTLKPILVELVRTQYCFPNIKLLVDRIDVVTVPEADPATGNEAFKFVLTDGEGSIQALLKRRHYKLVFNEDVREGSFVILRDYHIARGKRLDGNGEVLYLVIEDFFSIGEDGRWQYSSDGEQVDTMISKSSQNSKPEENPPSSKYDSFNDIFEDKTLDNTDHAEAGSILTAEKGKGKETEGKNKTESPTPPTSQQMREAMKRKWDTCLEDIDPNDPFRMSKYRKLEQEALERKKTMVAERAEAAAAKPLPNALDIPITLLAAVTGENKRRSKNHNILALIVSVSSETARRSGMPSKRDVQIMDTSTVKKVNLSVFENAENFHPQPGTVALFRHLRTHEFDGGSLNAYPKDCRGKEWFVPDPAGFEHGEVALLKDCWKRMQYSEEISLMENLTPLEIDWDELVPERKQLTCYYWAKNGSCRYSDNECSYAHYDTGTVADDPMRYEVEGRNTNHPPSKGLTCYFWANYGKCNRSDDECAYAHHDTGSIAHQPPQVAAAEAAKALNNADIPLSKQLTCYFWAKDRKCNRSDKECAYAHYDTGTVAHPPPQVVAAGIAKTYDDVTDSPSKQFTCYFWPQDGKCKRSDEECTYAHHDTGIVANPPKDVMTSASATSRSTTTTMTPAQHLDVDTKSLTCYFYSRSGRCNKPDDECAYAHFDTGIVAENPCQPLVPEKGQKKLLPNVSLPSGNEPQKTGKQLTCYFWSRGGYCTRSDAECTYAHYDTGTIAPPPPQMREPERGQRKLLPDVSLPAAPLAAAPANQGHKPAKQMTCYFWSRDGKCNRSNAECAYAHWDTGTIAPAPPNVRADVATSSAAAPRMAVSLGQVPLPPGPDAGTTVSTAADATGENIDNTVENGMKESEGTREYRSVKHLTCYFWANFRRCSRGSGCWYAHFWTGKMAGNPSERMKGKGG